MRNVKVLINVDSRKMEGEFCVRAYAHRVNKFGVVEHQKDAYEPFQDENVVLLIRVWDIWEERVFPLDRVDAETLRLALYKINLQI